MIKEIKAIKDLFYNNNKFSTEFDEYDDYIVAKTFKDDFDDDKKEVKITENVFTMFYLDYTKHPFYIESVTNYRYYDYDDNYKGCNHEVNYGFAFDDVASMEDFIKANVLNLV